MRLWTVGYGAWPASSRAGRLVESLAARGVTRLVDVRLSPCARTDASALDAEPIGAVDQLGGKLNGRCVQRAHRSSFS